MYMYINIVYYLIRLFVTPCGSFFIIYEVYMNYIEHCTCVYTCTCTYTCIDTVYMYIKLLYCNYSL